jgi:purine-nucleoside phosphorylase
VTDHANLTWWSPLRGRNDATLGPRFPVMAGLYRPEVVEERLPDDDRVAGIVAQVTKADGISGHEAWAMQALGLTVATVELAPVAILAAHLGYGLAAVVVVD